VNVIFDFDRTLTHGDTTYSFYAHAARTDAARRALDKARTRRRLRLLSRAQFKTLAAEATLAGLTHDDVVEAARTWAPTVQLRSNVVMRMRTSVDKLEDVYVVTASLQVAVAAVVARVVPMGREVHVVGSSLALVDDRVTGVDVMCEGATKVHELKRRHGVAPDVVFTDGRGDLPLMRAAREVHLVIAGRIVRVR
jgi:HAD superfamily phosphoserine phosphatase-like hydrolase